jgi:hypothetical protein
MKRRLAGLCLATLAACGGTEPILGPDSEPVPLTLENLTGRWEEAARIYAKLGVQTGVLRDTVAVPADEKIIYEFNLDDPGIVRRVQPNPGEAIISINGNGTSLTWVIGTFESYGASLSATRLSLNDGSTHPHVFPKDDFPTSSQVTHVYVRVPVP